MHVHGVEYAVTSPDHADLFAAFDRAMTRAAARDLKRDDECDAPEGWTSDAVSFDPYI